jgi:hypothetical protein
LNDLNSIRKEVEVVVREDFKKVVDDFSYKVRTFSLDKETLEAYFSNVKRLVDDMGYDKLIENLDLVSEAEVHYQDLVKGLATGFMRDRKKEEEDDHRNVKTL